MASDPNDNTLDKAVDQLADDVKEKAHIEANNTINRIRTQDSKTFSNAVKLHNARTYAQACGGTVPPHLDYGFQLDEPSLTGCREPDHAVNFSDVDPKYQTLDDRIALYRQKYPHWWPEMWETAARLDCDKRPKEKGQWQVVRNKAELKKIAKIHKLNEKRKQRRGAGGGNGKGKGKASAAQ